MKGADVAMSTIVQYNDWLEEEVRNRVKYILDIYVYIYIYILKNVTKISDVIGIDLRDPEPMQWLFKFS